MGFIVQSEKLGLRRFLESDCGDLFEYLSVPEVVRFEPYGPLTYNQCVNEVRGRAGSSNYWAVELKDGGKVIGNIFFKQREPLRHMTWELGYIFNRDYWGRGFATESAYMVMSYGFKHMGAHRIIATCNQLNERSWRLMERLGMRRELTAKQDSFFRHTIDGRPDWFDSYQYAILAEEFRR